MSENEKRLTVNGGTYVLTLKQRPDAAWECTVLEVATGQSAVVSHPKKPEAQYFGHWIAYDMQGKRRDTELEKESAQGWN